MVLGRISSHTVSYHLSGFIFYFIIFNGKPSIIDIGLIIIEG